MSVYHGKDGIVEIGAAGLASVQNFDYTEVTESVDGSGMGEDKTYLAGQKDGSGSVVCNHDTSDAGQTAAANGDSVSLTLQGEGAGAGKVQHAGTVLIDNVRYTTSKNGVAQLSFTFKGILTKTVQV